MVLRTLAALAAVVIGTAAAPAQTFERVPVKPSDPAWEPGFDTAVDCSPLPRYGPDPRALGLPGALAAAERRELPIGAVSYTSMWAEREPDPAYVPALKRLVEEYRCFDYDVALLFGALEAAGEPASYFLGFAQDWRRDDRLASWVMNTLAVRRDSSVYPALRAVALEAPAAGKFARSLQNSFNYYVAGIELWDQWGRWPVADRLDLAASITALAPLGAFVVQGPRGDTLALQQQLQSTTIRAIPRRLLRRLARAYPSAVDSALTAYEGVARARLAARGVAPENVERYLRLVRLHSRETAFPKSAPPLPPAVEDAAITPSVCLADPADLGLGRQPDSATMLAEFSYRSDEPGPVRVPYGNDNLFFAPYISGPTDSVPPEVFFPDSDPEAPGRTFRVALESDGWASWYLFGFSESVRADSTTRFCWEPEPVPPPVCAYRDATVYVSSAGTVVGGPSDGLPYDGVLVGTDGPDVLVGTDGVDRIEGGGGDDTVCALGGDDRVLAGEGFDDVDGGDGDDDLDNGEGGDPDAGFGLDFADGGAGYDVCTASVAVNCEEDPNAVDPAPRCLWRDATVYVADGVVVGGPGDGQIYTGTLAGTDGPDVIVGTDGPDLVQAGPGDDTVCALAGDDHVEAGDGDDRVEGGAGDDRIEGGDGEDYLRGNDGDDVLDNGDPETGLDYADGGDGYDVCTARLSSDCEEGPGVIAPPLPPVDPPAAVCETGTPTVYVSPDGLVVGGPDDGLPYAGVLQGTAGADVIFGTDGPDDVRAREGDDVVCGFAGDDELDGGPGDDEVFGGDGADLLRGGLGADLLIGDSGDDTLQGGDGSDDLIGDSGDDTLVGGEGNDFLIGNDGADEAQGGPGTDTCDAETEAECEVDNDPVGPGLPVDPSARVCAGQLATIYVADGVVVGGPGDGQLYTGTLTGTDGADVILGTDGPDAIFGQGGDDAICGGSGLDTLYSGDTLYGDDQLNGGPGDDWVVGDLGDDDLRGGAGDDMLIGGPGTDSAHGDDGSDACDAETEVECERDPDTLPPLGGPIVICDPGVEGDCDPTDVPLGGLPMGNLSGVSNPDVSNSEGLTRSAVRPILECVSAGPPGLLTAVFGYENYASVPVVVSRSPSNRLSFGGGAQPQAFGVPRRVPGQPGRTPPYPGSAFTVAFPTGLTVTWTLLGQTVTANEASPRCPE